MKKQGYVFLQGHKNDTSNFAGEKNIHLRVTNTVTKSVLFLNLELEMNFSILDDKLGTHYQLFLRTFSVLY